MLAAIAPVRVATAPHIDGHLDDAAWTTVPVSDSFTQSFPHDGAAPSDPTRVQVAYDDDNLYIAIDCVQHTPLLARLTRRDRDVDDDRISVDLDTAHDRRSAFHFQVSAAGVMVDGLRYQDTELNTDWDEIWQAEAAATQEGWSAEFAIPLRILRIHARMPTWGFQVRRWVGTTGELDTWAYAPRDAGGEVSRYGELGPFEGLSPRQSIALVPFGLMRIVKTDRSVPSQYGDGLSAAAGLDVTWRPRSNVAVSAAVLPDFGQVEADQLVINLTTTEIEYPEKRPFFLQGMDVFQTPIQLLYTRRIGRTAAIPVLPDGVTQVQPAGAAPVVGAAKLVANAGGVEIAALSALTGGVDAKVDGAVTGGAALDEVPAVLGASHHVLRARVSGEGATLGVLGTAQLQRDDGARYPSVMDGALCFTGAIVTPGSSCGHDAYTGGIDAAWRSSTGTWVASGQVAGSRIENGPPLRLTDGTIVKSADGGIGSELRVAKEGGTFRGELSYSGYSRRFVIDDLGYLARSNVHRLELDLEAYSAQPRGPLLETRSRIEIFGRRNLDGLMLPSGYQWNVSGTGKGLWEAFVEVHWRPYYFDDREIGDGRALERAGRLGLELSLRSDPHRAVSASMSLATKSTYNGSETYLNGVIALRPRDNLELDVDPDVTIARGEPRFVDGADPAGPRFARLDATSLGVTTRATWTLQRNLTLQAYVQGLLATLRYRDAFTTDPADRVIHLDALRPAAFDPAMYDVREGALNATIVGRWEYAPGSTAFLVYSHAQIPNDDGTTFDLRSLPRGPSQNVVLLKLSWAWLR
ncbi:MAG TPA: DUF5916 domain-containing protein [Kofleriaceae bacterium]